MAMQSPRADLDVETIRKLVTLADARLREKRRELETLERGGRTDPDYIAERKEALAAFDEAIGRAMNHVHAPGAAAGRPDSAPTVLYAALEVDEHGDRLHLFDQRVSAEEACRLLEAEATPVEGGADNLRMMGEARVHSVDLEALEAEAPSP